MKRLFRGIMSVIRGKSESSNDAYTCKCIYYIPDSNGLRCGCDKADYNSIKHILNARGYKIVWKVNDDSLSAQSHGDEPQFHIRHNERVYKIQYMNDELFKVIYEFDFSVYDNYTAMSDVVIKVMSEFENTPIHFVYRDGLWRVWVGGYHLSHSDIEFYIKGYLIMIDRVINTCQERYNCIMH